MARPRGPCHGLSSSWPRSRCFARGGVVLAARGAVSGEQRRAGLLAVRGGRPPALAGDGRLVRAALAQGRSSCALRGP